MPVRTSAHNDQHGSHIARLPSELLDRIGNTLTTVDLGSLRLSCKLIERRLFTSFAAEFFGKKQFMLTPYSLQVLMDISRHPDISPFVSEVQLGTDRYQTHYPCGAFTVGDRRSTLAPDKILHYIRQRAAQLFLVNGGLDREMLAEAFSNLANLQKIVIRDNNSSSRFREYNAGSTGRRGGVDVGTCHWRSYGASTVDTGTIINDVPSHQITGGVSDLLSGPLSSFVAHVWITVLMAMASITNPQVRPKHLELLLRQRRSAIHDNFIDVPEFIAPRLQPVLECLEVLHLRVSFMPRGCIPKPFGIQRFLRRVPNLRHLRINLHVLNENRGSTKETSDLLLWLAHQPPNVTLATTSPNGTEPTQQQVQMFPDYVTFSKLEQFDLGGARMVNSLHLISCLAKLSTTLTGLAFHNVSLLSNTQEKHSKWPAVLRAIAKMPRLRNLDLDCISLFDLTSRHRHDITLRPAAPCDKQKSRYRGNSMGDFCETAAKTLVVDWPDTSDDEMNSSENDGGEEEVVM